MSTAKWPSLSVVMPNYNHGAYLPRSLAALLDQSAPASEVIVVDDASKDNSLEVLEGFAKRYPNLRMLRNEQNLGAVKAAQRGMAEAKGDYLFLPSADDEILPGFFEASLRLLAEHPNAASSCTVSTWFVPGSNLEWHMGAGMADRACYLSPDDLVKVGRRGKLPIPTCSVIMKRSTLDECGGFLPEFRWHADWYAITVPAFRYGMCYVPEPLSNVHLTPASFSRKGMRSQEQIEVLTRLLDRLNSPGCADVVPRIRDSAALNMFGLTVVRLMMSRREYRHFLTAMLVLRASHRSLEVLGRRILPGPIARLAVRLLYRQKPSRG